MISAGRLLWLVRRDFERGMAATWHHYMVEPKILEYRCPKFDSEVQSVPVHILAGEEQWMMTAWMLASWHEVTQRNWKIVLHDDGTLPEAAGEKLQAMFSNLNIVWRNEANDKMGFVLTDYPNCMDYREMHPLALKLFDVPVYAEADRYLLLDSDIIFFHRPDAILAWVDGDASGCWFNEDAKEGALISQAEAKRQLGVKLWERVNSGLCLIEKLVMDLDFCEKCLRETAISDGYFWRIEQTLIALCASRYGDGGLLPETYEVSLGEWAKPDAVARHYVGSVRDRFYAEGMARVKRQILNRS